MILFRLIKRIFIFALLLCIIIPGWAIAKTWYVAKNETIRKADAIVVMGAAQLNGRPGELLRARLEEAERIYKKDFASRIFTLGSGAPGDTYTEGGSSRTWLISQGISPRAITSVPRGRDSYSSLIAFSAAASKSNIQTIIIVTDPYHCLRSTTIARDQGFDATCSPARSGKGALGNAGLKYLIREAGAYLAYITLGRHGIHISDHVA